MRSFVVAANWKMHKSPNEASDFFRAFLSKAKELPSRTRVIFFVPATDLLVARECLHGSPFSWGAQNCYFAASGAFTGENSPAVLSEIGAGFCLVGHSERRTLFNESDQDTGKKVKVLHDFSVTPMLCVGETWAEREARKTDEVIIRQLRTGLASRNPDQPIIIAYEPVWAIGTGKVATPEQANEAHSILRKALVDLIGPDGASGVPILYGGSVKPENSAEIARQAEVDGFLVGGASLDVTTFLPLCMTRKE